MKKSNLKKVNTIIKEIENTRSKNNKNWMDLLRLAFKHAPHKAKKVLKDAKYVLKKSGSNLKKRYLEIADRLNIDLIKWHNSSS